MVDGGFFTGKYVLFLIEMKKFKTTVKRKAIDFQWLHDILAREFPGAYVASVVTQIAPIARANEKGQDEATISGQMYYFKVSTAQNKQFIRDILNHKDLRRSVCLEKFMFVSNYDDFVEIKKNLENFVPKRDIRTLITKKNIENDGLADFQLNQLKSIHGYVEVGNKERH